MGKDSLESDKGHNMRAGCSRQEHRAVHIQQAVGLVRERVSDDQGARTQLSDALYAAKRSHAVVDRY